MSDEWTQIDQESGCGKNGVTSYPRTRIVMRRSRLFLPLIVLLTAVAVAPGRATAQGGMHASFSALIDALNAANQAEVQTHLSPSFTLTFTGGTTVTGSEALQMLMLLDTPITIVSATAGGDQKGSAVLEFGGKGLMYTVSYTGARGGMFATWTISEMGTTSSNE
jgi:hypothetical protein